MGVLEIVTYPDKFLKQPTRPVEFSTEGVYLCGTAHYP